MQKKTIKLIIRNKMLDFLSSITDEKLRLDVEQNLIVTGGCITSLLLGEKVNDFDIYIKDVNVLHRIAEYYVHKSGAKDSVEIMSYNPSVCEDDKSRRGCALRTTKADQIKLFMVDGANSGFKPAESIEQEPYGVVFISPNAISLTDDVQIVTRFSGEPNEIHKNYDYVHATNYFTFQDGLVLLQPALESIISKQLKYQGSLYPITSIIRMRKFIKRGWNIGAGEILKMCFQVSELDLKNPDVLEEQLIGVDIAYFGLLIEMLKNIGKEQTLTQEYIFNLIDIAFDRVDDAHSIES